MRVIVFNVVEIGLLLFIHKSPDFFQCVDICLPEVSFQSKSQKRINRKFHLKYTAWTKQNVSEVSCLWEGPATKLDEFLRKCQTAFDPPPHFWKIVLQILYDRYGCIYICEEIWWLDSMKCMHMISRCRCNTIVIQYNCKKYR